MSRVINTETAGKVRNRLVRAVVLSIRELMKQPEPNQDARDQAAFIALALLEIFETVDASVQAWEKKGYWVKADRFRMEWDWTQRQGEAMRKAVLAQDWPTIATIAAQTAQKLGSVTIPARHRLGTPWVGAYQTLLEG